MRFTLALVATVLLLGAMLFSMWIAYIGFGLYYWAGGVGRETLVVGLVFLIVGLFFGFLTYRVDQWYRHKPSTSTDA